MKRFVVTLVIDVDMREGRCSDPSTWDWNEMVNEGCEEDVAADDDLYTPVLSLTVSEIEG
jgi:hypothetical protein